jgi:hypothetical protein
MNTKSVNEHFFDKESRAMWYILGLSYSRYSASDTDNRNSWYSSNFKVLKIIKRELKSKHKIGEPNSNGNRILQIRSQPLQDRLVERGLGVPKNQREFPQDCDTKYLDHFIRGFFDGKVSCANYETPRANKSPYLYKSLQIYHNVPFLEELYSILVREAGVREGKMIINSSLTFKTKGDISKIKDFIYGNLKYIKQRGLYLPDKKARFEI